MVKVKVLETFHLASSGVTYTQGEDVQVSDALAKKYEGTRFKSIKTEQPPKVNTKK